LSGKPIGTDSRTDLYDEVLEQIETMINDGKTPNEIMALSLRYREKETIIKKAFFAKRDRETPPLQDMLFYWHVGESRTGKSYERIKRIEEIGEENVYLVDEYTNPFDMYNGEPVIFFDEFRPSKMKYSDLLKYTEGYKGQIRCRYANGVKLWNEVHLSSVLPPEKCYQKMVDEYRDIDTLDQLMKRITAVVYHWIHEGEYCKVVIPMSEYTSYEDVKRKYDGLPQWAVDAGDCNDDYELPL
jgi:hypothetical protein